MLAVNDMQHGISGESWESYLNQTLAAGEKDRLEGHLRTCRHCWDFHERLVSLTSRLEDEGEAMRHRYPLSDVSLQAALRSTLIGIHLANLDRQEINPVQMRLQELEAVLTVFCGPKAAVQALESAARKPQDQKVPMVSQDNWDAFMERLSRTTHVLVGHTGAHLVRETGRL